MIGIWMPVLVHVNQDEQKRVGCITYGQVGEAVNLEGLLYANLEKYCKRKIMFKSYSNASNSS